MGLGHRKVIWSDEATRELDEAMAYVAGHSPQSAVRLLDRILSAADTLTSLAERGRTVPERRNERIRELHVEPYRLIYAVGASTVVILAVLHQRRDFGRWADTGRS
jgi:plasmid stabilization system protein ParE